MDKGVRRWSVLWRSNSRLDGKVETIQWHECKPLLFKTRDQAREWIKVKYGYLRNRPDLKAEPHGWKMPIPVKVDVILRKVE